MDTSFNIRKATQEDAEIIARFNIEMALETENKVLQQDKIDNGVRSLFKRPELGFYMVAEVEGTVIGSLMITKEWSDWRNGVFWWMQSVYVVPEFRRKGVYRSMYQKIKELAAQKPDVCGFRLYVENENRIAQKVYSDLGMDETHYKMFEGMK